MHPLRHTRTSRPALGTCPVLVLRPRLLTQFLQNILGYSPVKAGFAFLPVAAGIGIAAQIASRTVGRTGVRPHLLVGPACAAVGLAWLSRLTVTSGYLDVLGPLLLIAFGMGLSFVALTLSAVSGVRAHESGLASALLNTGQQVGGALGLAVLATVAIQSTQSKVQSLAAAAQGRPSPQMIAVAVTHGYTTAFEVGALIAAAAFVISLIAIRSGRPGASETVAATPSAAVAGSGSGGAA